MRAKPEAKLIYTPYHKTASGWRAGTPSDVKPYQPPCTHKGACRFPFKECDGGAAYSTETI